MNISHSNSYDVVDVEMAKSGSYDLAHVNKQQAATETSEDNYGADAEIDSSLAQSWLVTGFEAIKYTYSLVLLAFSICAVMAAMVTEQTTAPENGLPVGAAIPLFWVLLLWLGLIEGGQGALVGLQPTPKDQYAQSHPITLKCTKLAHAGDNMERFICGRQFLVVLLIFLINMCGSAIGGANVLNMAPWVAQIFLGQGVAMILITVNIGQLTAQVNASDCMLDFINNYFMLASTYISLAIEASGLLHSVYLVQIAFSKLSGTPVNSNEPPRAGVKLALFWGRVVMSLGILGFALAVQLDALFKGWTNMWAAVPAGAAIPIVFLLLGFVGIMEGMQIAAFAVVKQDESEYRDTHKIAHANCSLLFRGSNLPRFLIGRQLLVCASMFVAARVFSINKGHPEIFAGSTSFEASSGFQDFINTGLLGAVITTIIGCLIWRIIAAGWPLVFMSNPVIFFVIHACLFLESTGLCAASWVLGYVHKHLPGFDYQPDAVRLEGAARKVTRRDKDIEFTITGIKYLYSLLLLGFSTALVFEAIITNQNAAFADWNLPAAAALPILCVLLLWLALIEGGQGALVGLQPTPKDQYAQSHPITLKCTTLSHAGDNMERFICGRQFLVVLLIFLINTMGGAVGGAQVFNMAPWVIQIFLGQAVAMILLTVNIGQLTAQVNAADCMLDFINNHAMLASIYISLAIEASGLLHSVYLVQIAFAKITGKTIESNEPPRTGVTQALFWGRVVMSLGILAFALAVQLDALFKGWTNMWAAVPAGAAIPIVFLLLGFVGIMEGMQIAAFAVVKQDESEYRDTHKIAHANCQLLFKGKNLGRFLIGRQLLVCASMFVAARIFSINSGHPEIFAGSTSFNASQGFQEFLNTGLLGAVITTIIGCLIWRIIASGWPLLFMSNPVIYVIIHMCLLLDSTGICSASWALGGVQRKIFRFKPDEHFLPKGAAREQELSLSASQEV